MLLKPGEPVILMGPTGTPAETPAGETVLLAGGGLGNAVLFSIGRAFTAAGSRVLYFAGYKRLQDRYKVAEIEAAADVVVWASDEAPGFTVDRPQDKATVANIVEAMRRYAAAEVSLDEVARVCRAFDVTLNDVALAAITDAFRAVLIGRGEKPQRNSLRTLVPVSVRSNDHIGKVDNRVSLMLPYLPVEKSDPEDQLRTVHSRMTRAKGSGQRQAGHIFVSAGNIIPFPLTAWAVRAATPSGLLEDDWRRVTPRRQRRPGAVGAVLRRRADRGPDCRAGGLGGPGYGARAGARRPDHAPD